MNKKSPRATTRTVVVGLTLLTFAAGGLSQTQRRPAPSGGSSYGEQQGDVFSSNSDFRRRRTNCNTSECPCRSILHLEALEISCANIMKSYDELLARKEREVEGIRQVEDMRRKRLGVSNPDRVSKHERDLENYRKKIARDKMNEAKRCECLRVVYKQMCSLSQEEFASRQRACSVGETSSQEDSKGKPERSPLPWEQPAEASPTNGKRIPAIVYKKDCSRSLIYVNNPEQLHVPHPAQDGTYRVGDLGDRRLGNNIILKLDGKGPGKFRNFFEHLNLTGREIYYDVQVYNPNSRPVTVILNGGGYAVIESFHSLINNGGKPFEQMFNSYSPHGQKRTVAPHKSLWMIRELGPLVRAPHTKFLTGVVDFEIQGGAVIINNVAYSKLEDYKFDPVNDPEGSARYKGYNKYIDAQNTHEARVYKGINDCVAVSAKDVNFSIEKSDKPGPLEVKYSIPGMLQLTRSSWLTNISRNMNSSSREAIGDDMFSFFMPGYGTIDPNRPSDAENKYPNLGNWGVVYTLAGDITNNSGILRDVSVNLKANPISGAAIAYRGCYNCILENSSVLWHEKKLRASEEFAYLTFRIRPGATVHYEASYVLGGPSGGALVQSVSFK